MKFLQMLSFSCYQLCIEQHLTWFHWYSVGCLISSFKLRLIKMFLNANLSNNDSYEHNQSVKLTIKLVRVWEVFCWIKSDGTFTSTLALRQPSHKLMPSVIFWFWIQTRRQIYRVLFVSSAHASSFSYPLRMCLMYLMISCLRTDLNPAQQQVINIHIRTA